LTAKTQIDGYREDIYNAIRFSKGALTDFNELKQRRIFMTNEKKAEKVKASAGETAEFSKELSDDDMEQVSGGAFNPEAVSKYGLDVKTGKSGTQGLIGTLTYKESSGSHAGVSRREGVPISENALRTYMDRPGELSVEVRTTSGKPLTLGKNELKELFS
jgi:hypothetical protein